MVVAGLLLVGPPNFAPAQSPGAGDLASQRRVPTVSAAQARALGLRLLEGRHLVLITDLAPAEQIDRLPQVFDLAVPIWAAYFDIAPDLLRDWRVQGYLIDRREPFDRLGLMPSAEYDQFVNGFATSQELWLYDQPSDYYRRHLLLHEGTHAFMTAHLGSCGPGWFMEGTAELMATHHWQGDQLTLRHFPRRREEVPMWGRIKLVQEASADERALSLATVLAIGGPRRLSNESYAWCWALAKFLDGHVRYGDRFRQLRDFVRRPDFTRQFAKLYAADRDQLEMEWNLFVADLEYGYDLERNRVEFRPGRPLAGDVARVAIRSDRGWQSSGVELAAGREYRITAEGRYQIRRDDVAWPCEPGGITIEYYRGEPLGKLMGLLRASSRSQPPRGEQEMPLRPPTRPLGLSARIRPETTATLYLRINESAAELGDNSGDLVVTIAAD